MSFPAAVQSVDEAILHAARHISPFGVTVFYVLTLVGGGWGVFTFIPFLVRRATRTATVWLLGAVVCTTIFVSLIKAIVGRVRPCNALAWCVPMAGPWADGPSFPSGHSAGSFAFATYIAFRAPRYAPAVMLYAALVAWSRCVLGVHYPSDILAGALLGGGIGGATAMVAMRREGSLQ